METNTKYSRFISYVVEFVRRATLDQTYPPMYISNHPGAIVPIVLPNTVGIHGIHLSHPTSKPLYAMQICTNSIRFDYPAIIPSRSPLSFIMHPVSVVRQVLLVTTPPPEQTHTVLDGVDGVADKGEDDKETDYDYCDDDVSFDHFGEGRRGRRVRVDAVTR